MPTYIYETIPTKPKEKPVLFEVQQSMKDEALKIHPQTGQPVRRVITGGYGIMKGGGSSSPMPQGTSCGAGCGCH